MARQRSRKRGDGGQGGGLSRRWTWLFVLALVAAFGAFVFEPMWRPLLAPAPLPPGEQVALGGRLYRQHCAPCHGPQAEGQQPGSPNGGTRADGTYIAPALNGTAHAWHHSPQQLFQVIRNGSPAADSPMRGWAGRLADREIEALLAYIRSLWPEPLRERYRGMHRMG
jgi:mono/diheme cytochrome c family protein